MTDPSAQVGGTGEEMARSGVRAGPGPTPEQAVAAMAQRADYPLFVVTAAGAGERSGCLAGFVTQSSILPPRFLICISKVNHTFRVAERAPGLALHLLAAGQREQALLFGQATEDTVDKFARCRWRPGRTGAPVLEECAAWVEGGVLERFTTGDHEAFLISCLDGGPGPGDGILTYRTAGPIDPGHPATA